jgi:regulatory protein
MSPNKIDAFERQARRKSSRCQGIARICNAAWRSKAQFYGDILMKRSTSLKERALRLLALREHSRLELKRKLASYAENDEDLDALLNSLEEKRLLSDERFSEALIRQRLDSYGNRRILAELQTHGLDAELLKQSKAVLVESEVARARALWIKKFGYCEEKFVEKSDEAEWLEAAPQNRRQTQQLSQQEQRAKQIRYLAQRGFSTQAIKAAIGHSFDELGELE